MDRENEYSVLAKGAILATGRFFTKGLCADRKRIFEPLLDIYVDQPQNRNSWHQNEFFDARGHSINKAGLITDEYFRPINDYGVPVYENIFSAGSILAHNDANRMGSNAGVAIATAFKAVESFSEISG